MFPTDPVPVVVEIAPGADPAASPGTWSWQDITTQVRLADRIEMVTGRRNEASTIDPARCTMRLNNTDGDFTPRNPYGQWYGTLGRNTPLRVSIRRVEDAFGRTSSLGWGTADSGQAWSVYGLGGTVFNSDCTVGGGKASQSVPATNAYRTAWLPGLSVLDCRVRLSGVALPFSDVTGGSVEPGNIVLRAQSSSQYYMARVEITTAEAVVAKLYNPAGTQLASATITGITHSSSQTLEVLAEIVGNRLAMKVWPTGGSEPAGWHVTATDDSLTLPGGIGVRTGVAAGNTNTLPVVASYESVTVHVDRFSGFVSSWPPQWDPTGNNSTVPIQADGVLRRLSQGSPAARSPLRRTIAATSPSAYWPGEDGAASKQLASAVAGHPAMTVTGSAAFVQVADTGTTNVQRYGSAALVNLASGARLAADIPGEVTLATATRWTVHVRADVDPAVISGNFVVAEWSTPGGTWVRWQVVVTALDSKVIAYNAAGSPTTMVTGGLPFGLAAYAVTAEQSGGNIFITYWPNTPVFIPGTLTGVSSIASNTTGVTGTAPVTVGHFAVWPGITVPYNSLETETDSYGELIQSVGLSARYEAANLRLARLCAEDGVQLTVPAVAADAVARMGWQPVGTRLDLYRQCEATDQGVLHELGFGLGYLPRDFRYNRATALTLDYAAGQVAPPFEPVDDDQLLRNRVTVRRIDGSEATAQDAASVAAVGPYEQSVDVSISAGSSTANDDQPLLNHASWRTWVGSTPVMRWPAIRVNLARSPELIDAVLSARVQSRVAVDNPPAQAVGDDIDVLVEGYSETIGHKEWLVGFNTSPAAVWDVATVDGEQRVAADESVLAAALTSGGTSLLLASTTLNGTWTTDGADFPLDMRVGGERVVASGITSTVRDTFARTTSNGWGTSDTGHAWVVGATPNSDYSTNGSEGVISLSATNSERRIVTDLGSAAVQELRLWCTLPVTPTGAAINWGALLRWQDASNYYWVDAQVNTDSTVTLRLVKRVAGTLTQIASTSVSVTHSTSVPRVLVGRADGSMLSAKVFASDGSEPAWQLQITDSDLTTGTGVGAVARLMSGNTNTTPVSFRFANLAVRDPQTVTLSARAVNGVNRAWDAGAEVDVWFPAIVGL